MEEKIKLANKVTKNAIAQGAGAVVSNAFATLMTLMGLPESIVFTPLVQGAAIGVFGKFYDDFAQRILSPLETKKLDLFSKTALQTFFELAEKDGVTPMQQRIEEGQMQYAYEAAEGAMLTAIRQSMRAKIKILGHFFGSQLYQGRIDWQDMHYMLNMVDELTLRQLVMIRLIADEFKDYDHKLFISNPCACVEINRLLELGIWQTKGAPFAINKSRNLLLESIISSDYSKQVSKSLMLDRLAEEDIRQVVGSLHLTTEGTPTGILTEEEYMEHSRWH